MFPRLLRKVGGALAISLLGWTLVVGAPPSTAAGPAAPVRPTTWCGAERPSDDSAHEVPNGRFKFHAIYLVPRDGLNRFGDVAAQIQASTFGASALLEHLYGRSIRLDLGTNCGPEFLDISVVRSDKTVRAFEAAARRGVTLETVSRSIRRAGYRTLPPRIGARAASRFPKNFMVWLDAPGPARTCGLADTFADQRRTQSNWNNFGGKVAVVLKHEGQFCGPAAVRHEIAHSLGALQAASPHGDEAGHCSDAYEDTMCTPNATRRGSGAFENEYFDYGNDDYWDPPGGQPLKWWTLNLSRFICSDLC